MNTHFNSIEEVIADEFFHAWYFKSNEIKAGQWEIWLSQNSQYQPFVQESIAWLDEHFIQEKEISPGQIEAAYQKLSGALNAAPVITIHRKKRWWVPAAAAIILLIGGFVFLKQANNKTTLNSSYGAISEYQLPDGSKVTLNANSEITINKEWAANTDREVWLKGEAFFKVQKTPMKNRFIVHTNSMDIIVTGTQFNVMSREDESSVLLTEGSVTIQSKDGKEIKMKPGDFVKIENEQPAKEPVDQQKVLAWKQLKLDFDKTPMNEVAKIISRHYGVKVTITDKFIEQSTITGVMPNDNLDILIQALEATGNYKINKLGNEITIASP